MGMTIAIMLSKIAAVGGVGFGVSTAFQWFNTKEVSFNKKNKKEVAGNERIEHLRKKLES